ncbi:MAG: VacJ family lipoprotein [Pseudomonadota bacterium]
MGYFKAENTLKMFGKFVAVAFCAGMLSACTTPVPSANSETTHDPIEPLNRGIFQFNYAVDTVLLKPVAQGYDAVMPKRGQTMVSNFVSNIKEPVTFANSVLQTDANNSFTTLWRFLFNSTFGIAGLFDVASELGLKNRETGLGDTFAIYGADAGPYLMIPVFGPSSVRDGIGRAGDVFLDPISYTNNPVFYSVVAVKTIEARHRNMKLLNDIYNSIDPYSTMRSIYTQFRAKAIKNAINQRNKSLESAKSQDSN